MNRSTVNMPIVLESFAEGKWVAPAGALAEIPSAIDGHVVAVASSAGLDFGAMARHARSIGGPALRRLTFHERADMLKRLAVHLTDWSVEGRDIRRRSCPDAAAWRGRAHQCV